MRLSRSIVELEGWTSAKIRIGSRGPLLKNLSRIQLVLSAPWAWVTFMTKTPLGFSTSFVWTELHCISWLGKAFWSPWNWINWLEMMNRNRKNTISFCRSRCCWSRGGAKHAAIRQGQVIEWWSGIAEEVDKRDDRVFFVDPLILWGRRSRGYRARQKNDRSDPRMHAHLSRRTRAWCDICHLGVETREAPPPTAGPCPLVVWNNVDPSVLPLSFRFAYAGIAIKPPLRVKRFLQLNKPSWISFSSQRWLWCTIRMDFQD